MASVFVYAEAVNFSSSIYDTNDIGTVRGGSYAVADAMALVEPALRDGFRVQSIVPLKLGASVGFFQCETGADQCERIEQHLTKVLSGGAGTGVLHSALRHATIQVAVVAEDDPITARTLLQNRIRWKQATSASLVYPTTDPGVRHADQITCQEDRVRPATRMVDGDSTRTTGLSHATMDRRAYGRKNKYQFLKLRLPEAHATAVEALEFPTTLEELTDTTRSVHDGPLSGRMAVISADGNSFGKIAEALAGAAGKTPAAVIRAMRTLDTTIQSSQRTLMSDLVKMLTSAPQAGGVRKDRVLFEALVWAGDEYCIVVPAWRAWQVLHALTRSPSTIDIQGDAIPLTYSIGMVICKHSTPISSVIGLAKQLEGHAKGMAKESTDRSKAGAPLHQTAVAYEVLDSFDHVGGDFRGYRARQRDTIPEAHLVWVGNDLADRFSTAARVLSEVRRELPVRSVIRLAAAIRRQFDGDDALRSKLRSRVTDLIGQSRARDLEQSLGPACWVHVAQLRDLLLTESVDWAHASTLDEGAR